MKILLCPPVLNQISYPKWWCGAYQYCLKLILCCCIQRYCSSCFWDKFSSGYIFYIVFLFVFYFSMWYQVVICVFFVTDPLSAIWNHMDEYNLLQSSRQNNLWRSAWQSALLHWILGLILYLEWVHYKKVDLLGKIMGVPNLSNNILTQSLSWGEKVCCIRNKLCAAEQAWQMSETKHLNKKNNVCEWVVSMRVLGSVVPYSFALL